METNSNDETRIAALEKALRESENKAQKYAQEIENLRHQYADDLFAERQAGKRLHEERHQLQLDYERLRVQKGGFGLKALAFSGFTGFFGALVFFVLYVLFRPKDDHTAAFLRFREANMFNYELALSQGRFDDVERDLGRAIELPQYRLVQPEIEFTQKMIGAAKRHCEKAKR